jgi:HAD superfamily hydrolase (TIGR01509 family)
MTIKPPLDGILFDFDGLILDTETTIFQAWQQKFREYGQELLLEEWAEIIGKSGSDFGPIKDFLNSIGDDKIQYQIRQEVSRREMEMVIKQKPLPGAVDLIKKTKQAKKKLGIVSSSSTEWVIQHLTRVELIEYFDDLSCSDEVDEAKPDPALYKLGLKKMGCEPSKVIVLEDSPNGVLAAKRAGLYCIAVPNGITKQLPYYQNGGTPDRVLSSLEDFPWDEYMKVDQ